MSPRKNPDPTVFKLDDYVIFQMVGDENRLRNRKQLRDVMIYILNLIHRCRLYAGQNELTFHGLTLYEMQNYLKRAGISNDAVRENLRKLHTMGLIVKEKVKVDGVRFRYAYFDLNTESFPCRFGKWIVFPTPQNQLKHIYTFNCAEYPFCPCATPDGTLDPKKCSMIRQLNSLLEDLPDYIDWLKSRKFPVRKHSEVNPLIE